MQSAGQSLAFASLCIAGMQPSIKVSNSSHNLE